MTNKLKKEIENLINFYKLNCSIENFENNIDWNNISNSQYQKLSKDFIKKYKDYVNWDFISAFQKLSEDFIEKYKDYINWYFISQYQKLSENFIEKHKDYVNWHNISVLQKLSEDFIERHKNKVNWHNISKFQKLSEFFIEKFKYKVNWDSISTYQKLSESFIKRYKDYVDWKWISTYQKLSESFIERYKDYVNWDLISNYQKLSPAFRKKYKLKVPRNNTNYMTKQEISELIPDCYKREGDYVIAYKNIRTNRYSQFNFQYKYEKGNIYESHCDCNNDKENSFGLSLWTEEKAKDFRKNGIVVKCRVKIEDIGAVVHAGSKLRCKRIEVLE